MSYKHLKSLQKVLPIVSLIACFLSPGCIVYPELAEKGMKAPKSERCGDCHRDIYNEWKDSPHAHSFTNTAFKEETNNYQFAFCLGCHAPETIFTDKRIEPRGVNLAEGVNCNSCHLNDCKLSGPTAARGPHPIAEKNQFFRTSEMCGKCHVGTFRTWQEISMAENKKTCQDCHMPAIKRKLIQDDPWQKIYPKREGKQHLFSFQHLFNQNDTPLQLSFKKVTHSDGKIDIVTKKSDWMYKSVSCTDCHKLELDGASFKAVRKYCIECHNPDYGLLYDAWKDVLDSKTKQLYKNNTNTLNIQNPLRLVQSYGVHNFSLSQMLLKSMDHD